MHIFIDESGIFLPTSDANKWSSVGALVVPDESLQALKDALSKLKTSNGLEDIEEFKRNRPDCSSESFSIFLDTLFHLNCTLHVLSTNGSPTELSETKNYKENIKHSIRKYSSKVTSSASLVEELVNLIDELSDQQFCQCMLQSYMLKYLLDKVVLLYAEISPESLSTFRWKLDQKNLKETSYEVVFKHLYSGIALVSSLSQPGPICLGSQYDYSHFLAAFSPISDKNIDDTLEESLEIFEKDLKNLQQALIAIDINKVLTHDFELADSKDCFGLQSIDLLVSSVNRCLKQNFTDNEKMAASLGQLMVNSPLIKMKALSLMSFSSDGAIEEYVENIINIMDSSSKQLFSERFRCGYSKSINDMNI